MSLVDWLIAPLFLGGDRRECERRGSLIGQKHSKNREQKVDPQKPHQQFKIMPRAFVFLLSTFVLLSTASLALAITYSCPDDSLPVVGNIRVETCQNPAADGSCLDGSDGLSLTVTGNGNVPKFTWGLLQSDETYHVMFQQLFETDSSGNRIPTSIHSLPSWTWTFCEPFVFSNESDSTIHLDFFGLSKKDSAGMYIAVRIVNSSSTDSFKWSLNIDDYLLHPDSNLVLFAKYQDQNGQSSVSSDDDSELSNGHSFIRTDSEAIFNDNISIPIDVSNDGESDKGYYITFDFISAGVNSTDN